LGRLYSSAFYSLLDTRTPLRFAVIRVLLTTALGLIFALLLPRWLGIDPKWGAAGLTASAGIAGWVEFALLRKALHQRIGDTGLQASFTLKLWAIASAAAVLCLVLKIALATALGVRHPLLIALAVLPVYGAGYFGGTLLINVAEAKAVVGPILRRVGLR
jgi:putative peptidoglycan lipid II flippase